MKCSGKFLILDRMLPALKKRGHKVKGMGPPLFSTLDLCWFNFSFRFEHKQKAILERQSI